MNRTGVSAQVTPAVQRCRSGLRAIVNASHSTLCWVMIRMWPSVGAAEYRHRNRPGLTVSDLDVTEDYEAFSNRACEVTKDLGQGQRQQLWRSSLGHPMKAIYDEPERINKSYALVTTMCIDGGRGNIASGIFGARPARRY
jgi:hypothetical protein